MTLGPLDRRTVRTRCQACARRKIKCEGGPPCVYCTKKKIPCRPQTAKAKAGVIFLHPTSTPSLHGPQTPSLSIPDQVSSTTTNRLASYFFSEFIVKNDFAGGSLDVGAITAGFQASPSLHHASVALAALDMSKNPLSSSTERRSTTVKALTAYRASITSFQSDIQNSKRASNHAALWTTFFLGIFELMYDTTGLGWIQHILHGTSQILQLRGPAAHLRGPGRAFFLTVRPFEISRSLIYSEPSFLSQPEWIDLMARIRRDDQGELNLKEEMFDLMLACSKLGERIRNAIAAEDHPPTVETLANLASQGLQLRTALESWQLHLQTVLSTTTTTSVRPNDPWTLLSLIYHHATSIYLSGLFSPTYHPPFAMLSRPPPTLPPNALTRLTLTRPQITHHTSSIIALASHALDTTRLAGILFFFPLRVAGARAETRAGRVEIMRLLRVIQARCWGVAGAFVEDLGELWGE